MYRWIFLGLYCCFMSVAQAIIIKDLYQEQLEINNKSKESRLTAMQNSFEKVLVRVSGTQSVLTIPSVIKDMQKLDSFINQYSYKQSSSNTLLLTTKFDSAKIEQLLYNAGQPVWGANRPLTVVWLALELQSTNYKEPLLSALLRKIEHLSKERGIPLMFPLGDIQDKKNVSSKAIWNMNTEILKEGAKRYDADTILVGRITEYKEKWHSRWKIIYDDSSTTWDVLGNDLSSTLTKVVDEVSLKLMNRYALQHSDSLQHGDILMQVSDVKDFQQHIKLTNYLQQLPAVKGVRVLKITKEHTLYAISSRSESKSSFTKSVELDRILARKIDNQTNDGILQYQLHSSLNSYKDSP